MPNWTHAFYNDPAYKKKHSIAHKKHRGAETPAQRELHNARQAVNYRKANAARLFDRNTYAGNRDAKKWIKIAEDRLEKALKA